MSEETTDILSYINKKVRTNIGVEGIIKGIWIDASKVPQFSVEYLDNNGVVNNFYITNLGNIELLD